MTNTITNDKRKVELSKDEYRKFKTIYSKCIKSRLSETLGLSMETLSNINLRGTGRERSITIIRTFLNNN